MKGLLVCVVVVLIGAVSAASLEAAVCMVILGLLLSEDLIALMHRNMFAVGYPACVT